jgi:hypothetical protein
MRRNIICSLTILSCLTLAAASASRIKAQNPWQKADAEVVRLSPNAFPELPRPISHKLISLGCTIPQAKELSFRHNVIKGHFRKPGQTDWAVLCSRKQISSIIIFWRGSVARFSEISRGPDEEFLQTIDGQGTIGFSRAIGAADQEYILEHYRSYDGPKPPPLNHEGIEDAFLGKVSTIYYYFARRWRELQGGD